MEGDPTNRPHENRPQAYSTLSSREDFLTEKEDIPSKKKKIFPFKKGVEKEETYEDFDLDDLPKGAYAGFWIRTSAYLIDLIFVSLFTALIFNLTIYRIWGRGIEDLWLVGLLELVIFVAYFALSNYSFSGQSFGKMLLGIRTIRADGQALDKNTLLVRELAGRVIIKIVPILAVFLIFDKQRRHLIDVLCNTVVINEKQLAMLASYQS